MTAAGRRRIAAMGALAFAAAVAGCTGGPQRRDDAVDPAIYEACQDPDGAAAWARAQQALARGDDAAALPDLLVATRACPLLLRAHLAYQDVARRAGGAAAQAMVDFYTSLRHPSPVPAYCRARLADTSYAQSNALRAILAEDPSFAWAHLSMARVTRRQGRLLPAVDTYQLAIVNDPRLHEARHERAQVLAELGREEEAAVDYKAYLEARPDDVGALRAYVALLLYRLNRTAEALPLLATLEARLPGDVGVRMDRAAALWRSGRTREAVDAYVAILADAPATTRAALNVGLLYYEIAPRNDAERARYWPRARAAFRWFLQGPEPTDGHEQFERTLGVPFRLERIAQLLGPAPEGSVQLEDLRWPANG
jgi:tetratricopeptide (TPR) repeat protein